VENTSQGRNDRAENHEKQIRPFSLLVLANLLPVGAGLLALGIAHGAEARVTSISNITVAPAYGGAPFGSLGAYQFVTGVANGTVDPADPKNSIIQDIDLAPRDARGLIEYSTSLRFQPGGAIMPRPSPVAATRYITGTKAISATGPSPTPPPTSSRNSSSRSARRPGADQDP
jgi:hypothetical protein